MAGIRLASGDLAHLSIETRRLLDEAGFPKAVIVASNDLDERTITSIKEGATHAEALANIRGAIALWLEAAEDDITRELTAEGSRFKRELVIV